MDSAIFAATGADTIVFGPDGAGAHAAEEWVDLGSVMRLARILAETVVAYCGT
jgi:acetylornithine deacetylase